MQFGYVQYKNLITYELPEALGNEWRPVLILGQTVLPDGKPISYLEVCYEDPEAGVPTVRVIAVGDIVNAQDYLNAGMVSDNNDCALDEVEFNQRKGKESRFFGITTELGWEYSEIEAVMFR